MCVRFFELLRSVVRGGAMASGLQLIFFFSLQLQRPSLSYLVRRCKFMIRKHRYIFMHIVTLSRTAAVNTAKTSFVISKTNTAVDFGSQRLFLVGFN